MRGEFCVAGASIASFIAVVLMVFTMIGQINPTSLPASIHMVEVNVAAYGAGLQGALKSTPSGLYDTKNDALGSALGLRQYYRWGLLDACGYQKDGSGVCNGTTFGYPFEPLKALIGDTPAKYRIQTSDIIPSSSFKDNSYNANLSRGAFWTIFIGSCACLVALVFGAIPHKLSFLVASAAATIGALGLLIGAAIWTALISKAKFVNIVKVEGGNRLGIYVSAGPALYLTWVSFAMITVSVIPYLSAAVLFVANPHRDGAYDSRARTGAPDAEGIFYPRQTVWQRVRGWRKGRKREQDLEGIPLQYVSIKE